ncbi:MAG: histidinol dehydrogenase [Proteobacteria bacterium]|nr:histidinol dehydrogenase [Pseudomonadota bacterium]
MVKKLNTQSSDFKAQLARLLDRDTAEDRAVELTVREIIDAVRAGGDAALMDFSRKFDRLELADAAELEFPAANLEAAYYSLDEPVQQALSVAAKRIHAYHEKEVAQSWSYTEADGTRLGQIITPLDSVGVYVPGGKAAYPSSVLMTVTPAKVAGVKEIIMVVPTPDGEVNPAVLAAAHLAGVDRVFSIGGAQAVAALAYGTETVPRVDKIVGPGNIYVATAKRQVFGQVGIDMIAGPSEVVVIADKKANADWAVMDLFAQAEHDELAQSILITDSEDFADAAETSIERLLPEMERYAIIEKSLKDYGAMIITQSAEESVEIANRIAPEHLELMVDNVDEIIPLIRHAGAIFAGRYSAESLGDYCAGPNHVLPTAGTARFSSPLGVYDYQKRSSLIQVSEEGADTIARIASTLARCEGLTGHARSAEFRFKPG